MKSSFKRKLVISYGVSLLLLIVSSIASYISIRNLLDSSQLVGRTNKVLQALENVVAETINAETGQRGFLLTGDERFLDPHNGAHQKALQFLEDASFLMIDKSQQKNALILQGMIEERFSLLQRPIDNKRKAIAIPPGYLEAGKKSMDLLRSHVLEMEQKEQALLNSRTQRQERFASNTPTLIFVASLLAILVTVVSFFKVNADYDQRVRLQKALEKKEEEVTRRISIIQELSDKIAGGDYKIRIDDERIDELGSLAFSLNKMTSSLDTAFETLSDNEWLQTGVAALSDEVVVEKDLSALTQNVLQIVAEYTNSQAGAFYLVNDMDSLELKGSYALSELNRKTILQKGEGIAGQCAASGKILEVTDLLPDDYTISYTAGNIRPRSIIAIPIFFNRRIIGVIELASLLNYSANKKAYFGFVAHSIGIAINTAQNKHRMQELLEETKTQSEELQSQHSDLENINLELEAQSEKLQASEEELRVQQEELLESNQELEERSRLLEEKNELILERNLDIQQKSDDLALGTKYKSEFLSNMSHELRTPLNSILLLSRLLSENHGGNLSTDQIEYATVIRSSGNGLLKLIDEILDLSKIEAGKTELEFNDVSVEEVKNEIRSLFAPLAKEKDIEFTIESKTGTPEFVETDKLRLEQILRNLISNALKFTKRGSVTLITSKESSAISFTVKDTGIGIPREKHQTIFEAFQQADGSTRRQFGGTGLGLSISRELARLLGGEIRLQSQEGKGSEFTLLIPIAKASVSAKSKDEFAKWQTDFNEEKPVEQPTYKNHISGIIPASIADDRNSIGKNDKIILIVEDDTGFARSLLDYTRKNGYKGIVAVRGDEGIELAKQFRPLGILLDIQLPVKSGWQVMEELKSDPVTRPIPVHIMSSHEVKLKSITKGAVDFINKPVALEKMGEIFQKIEQALNQHPKKVLIVEEYNKHAQALALFLESFNVNSEIKNSVKEGILALNKNEIDCVILDMGIAAKGSYETLVEIKKTPGLENLPIIVFTSKNLSHLEEMKIRQYADTIVVKTAHSYQRILDEVSLFLHVVEENKKNGKTSKYKKMGELSEVLKGKTVLVADDDVRNIFSLTRSLEIYGVNVISAIDGKDALKQLQEAPKVDLVLMDMMMPEMDGYEATKRIRDNIKYRNLPIIAITAKAMTGDREKCIDAGASDYITKPVDVDQLISLLRVWLYE